MAGKSLLVPALGWVMRHYHEFEASGLHANCKVHRSRCVSPGEGGRYRRCPQLPEDPLVAIGSWNTKLHEQAPYPITGDGDISQPCLSSPHPGRRRPAWGRLDLMRFSGRGHSMPTTVCVGGGPPISIALQF